MNKISRPGDIVTPKMCFTYCTVLAMTVLAVVPTVTSLEAKPVLEFHPRPGIPNENSTLIWYRMTERDSFQNWTRKLDQFLQVYRSPGLTPGRGQNVKECDVDHPPTQEEVCDVDVRMWAPCIQGNYYNFHRGGPCIFLKLNQIPDWEPEYYNNTDSLPKDMPPNLKEHIRILSPAQRNMVWVSCDGDGPASQENVGIINYIPSRALPGYFFPFKDQEGYLGPLVAVHFERPISGVLININCKAWAKNIDREKEGSVDIELLID